LGSAGKRVFETEFNFMKLHQYYEKTADRMEAWKDQAFDSGFAPCKQMIDVARPFLKTGGKVLDVGCQGGHQLALIADNYAEAYGLDLARYDELWKTFPSVRFMVHDVDAAPLPFPDGHFDCILCTSVLEHVVDVFGLVAELSRTLKPGGTCLLAVPNVAFFRHFLNLLRGRVPRTGANEVPFTEKQGWDGQHLHYFTHREVAWLFNRVGVQVTSVLRVGRYPRLKALCPRFLCSGVDVIGERYGSRATL
jgi:SAM-dependent methyltransferase